LLPHITRSEIYQEFINLADPGRRTEYYQGEMPVMENGRVVLSPTRRKRDPGTAATAPTECEVDQARQNELCHAVGLGTWSRYREEEIYCDRLDADFPM
jgi:hypothetical protein